MLILVNSDLSQLPVHGHQGKGACVFCSLSFVKKPKYFKAGISAVHRPPMEVQGKRFVGLRAGP